MSANTPPEEPVDVRVRRRLRQLRSERGLSLAQVAESASIDISTLSRLESGKRRLALDHVAPLAAALGVGTDQLLGADSPRDPRVRGRRRSFEGMTMRSLSRERAAAGLEAWRITISTRRRTPPDPLPVYEGHEWLYVLDGRLHLLLGTEDHTIEPGEAVEFSTWTPHWFGALELIGLFGPQGQRLHLRG